MLNGWYPIGTLIVIAAGFAIGAVAIDQLLACGYGANASGCLENVVG